MLENRILHFVARVVVRAQSPVRAKRIIDGLGRLLPPLSVANAMAVAQRLEGKGTCLTRALTIASRVRHSTLVIGVGDRDPSTFSAHAWVEHDGKIIAGAPRAPYEVARL